MCMVFYDFERTIDFFLSLQCLFYTYHFSPRISLYTFMYKTDVSSLLYA